MTPTPMPTTCPVCGSDVTDAAATTCPVCGSDLPEVSTTSDAPSEEDPMTTDVTETATGPTAGPTAGPSAPPPPPPSTGAVPPPPHRPAPPHSSGIPAEYRTWGMLTHLSSFAGAMVALAFLGPLVMWLIKKDEHPFLDHHGKEALNFNLSLLLYMVIGIVASILTLGLGFIAFLPSLLVGFVVWVVCTIQGAIKANEGQGYRYPITIRFIAD